MTYFKKCLMKHKFMYTQLTRTVLEMDFLGITLRENHEMSSQPPTCTGKIETFCILVITKYRASMVYKNN